MDLRTSYLKLVKSSTTTLLLCSTCLSAFLMFRHVSLSYQPRRRLFYRPPTPANLHGKVQSENCMPGVFLACSAASKMSAVILLCWPTPRFLYPASSSLFSLKRFAIASHPPRHFVETKPVVIFVGQCCCHGCYYYWLRRC
jgi:hypothetical protein